MRVFSIPTAYSPASLAQAEESAPLPAAAALKVLAVPHLETISATFTYDGDGNRVAQTLNGVTTYFIGGHYEQIGAPGGHNMSITKYYFAGRQRVAIRKDGDLSYLLCDHLGLTSITTDSTGTKTSELRYKPWGEVRYSWTKDMIPGLPTDYTFTGQRSYMDDPTTGATEGFGLMFYNARWYDSQLGRFAQADTIIPSGVQGLDRYAYVRNSPLNYTDPSGHYESCEDMPGGRCKKEPDKINRDLLSKVKGGVTSASGADLYDTYLDLWKNKDAWYWDDGDFTVWDFITLIFYKEAWTAMGSGSYAGFQEAWSRSFHTWCGSHASDCRGSSDPASVLNYLSRASESAGRLVNNPSSVDEPLQDWEGNDRPLSDAAPVVAGLFNPDWQRGCVGGRPCYVGNFSLFSTDMAKAATKQPWFFSVFGGGNPQYIMTLCQSFYWWGGYWGKGGNKEFRADYPNCSR